MGVVRGRVVVCFGVGCGLQGLCQPLGRSPWYPLRGAAAGCRVHIHTHAHTHRRRRQRQQRQCQRQRERRRGGGRLRRRLRRRRAECGECGGGGAVAGGGRRQRRGGRCVCSCVCGGEGGIWETGWEAGGAHVTNLLFHIALELCNVLLCAQCNSDLAHLYLITDTSWRKPHRLAE